MGSGTTLLSGQPPWPDPHLYPPDSGEPGRKEEALYVPDKTAAKGLQILLEVLHVCF